MAAILSTSFAQPATASASVWTLASVTGVQKGHVCAVESELAQVLQVGPGLTVTMQRGIEGTATAGHATSTPVAVYVANDVGVNPAPVSPAAVPLRQAMVTLTDAQIKALPTTSVQIVAAPGANTLLVPTSAVLVFQPAGPLYGNVATAFSGLTVWHSPSESWVLNPILNDSTESKTHLSAFLVNGLQSTRREFILFPYQDTAYLATIAANCYTGTENQSLAVKMDNGGSGNLTGGHASNTLTVTVLYRVLDVTTGRFV